MTSIVRGFAQCLRPHGFRQSSQLFGIPFKSSIVQGRSMSDAKSVFPLEIGQIWDSHVHVVDEERYPFAPNAPYRPKKADLGDLSNFQTSIGTKHVCIVSMSVYGNDNSLLVDTLKQLKAEGKVARGVVGIDPETVSDESMASMDALGVCGARLNLRSHAKQLSRDEFGKLLSVYERRLREFQWALQIYVSMDQIPLFADLIPSLDIPVVIDHLAHPGDMSRPPSQQPGYKEFIELLENKHIYTKLSGVDRFPGLPGLDEYVQTILQKAPTQVVWGSDWPHSGGKHASPGGDPRALQDYRKVNDAAFIAQCMHWCNHDKDLMRKIFVENPKQLWKSFN